MTDRSAFKEIGFYKLVYIFAVCCVIGFTVETAWCYLKNGYIESRKSLVYGPFSVAYGMGGVLLTLALYRFTDAQLWKVFLISYGVGTAAEYICSLGQEICFGSVAWDYSHLPLNVNGRVCLIYSLMWGALGVFWVKIFMPITDKLFYRIPPHVCSVVVWVFVVFFVYDSFISASAAARMKKRESGLEARNRYELYLDAHFDDERMHKIYANSRDIDDIPARNAK